MTQGQQPEALRLADELEDSLESYDGSSLTARCQGIADDAAAKLRRLHAENTALQQGYDAARMEIDGLRDRVQELGAMLRENCNRRIVELEAQLESIGAGGVEPLRRRECLHQIAEPAPAREYPALPDPDASTVGHGHMWNRHSMRAYVDADRAMRAQAAPAAVAVPSERWRERWHGSPTEQGWSIMHGRECIAYLGPDVSAEAVSAIVAAHNAAPTTPEAPPQEAHG